MKLQHCTNNSKQIQKENIIKQIRNFQSYNYLQHGIHTGKMSFMHKSLVKTEVKYKVISRESIFSKHLSSLISKYSWGEDYPINPIDEIANSEYIIGVFDNKTLIGGAYIHKSAAPDKIVNEGLWLCGLVVHPKYRNKGIAKTIFDMQMAYTKDKRKPAFSCTDNQIIINFFESKSWNKIRTTKDESGCKCVVYSNK